MVQIPVNLLIQFRKSARVTGFCRANQFLFFHNILRSILLYVRNFFTIVFYIGLV